MEKSVCELFAGVGGFRLGLERLNTNWQTVWFSQWEPGKKQQWAHDCYVSHFGDCADVNNEYHTGEDISSVDKKNIPDHSLLVGGFPCQDYSVAHSLGTSHGIEGKKGVLWWQIRDTIIAKKPAFCLFENVDRLLKSPASQRGRDFGIILSCLNELGYSAEWRVVNAAVYGAVQRRNRIFIFAYRNDTAYAKSVADSEASDIISSIGFMQKAFPTEDITDITSVSIPDDVVQVSDTFQYKFEKAGYMHDGMAYTAKVVEKEEKATTLGEILQSDVDKRYYISIDKLPKWTYLKGSKRIPRKSKDGHEYIYSEGPVAFPDAWDKPGRTMLTSEGTLNRCSHVVSDPATGNLRIFTPVETERMQGFDDDWTKDTIIGEMPERMRYFCMGNALVVPMITRMGAVLDKIIDNEP